MAAHPLLHQLWKANSVQVAHQLQTHCRSIHEVFRQAHAANVLLHHVASINNTTNAWRKE
jgi:hypothetical protein